MMNDDFRSPHSREELLRIKERAHGHIEQDKAEEALSDQEFLASEIAAIRNSRRSQVLPLVACGAVLAGFSQGAATLLTRAFAFAFGLGSLCIGFGIWLAVKHTQRLKALEARLERA